MSIYFYDHLGTSVDHANGRLPNTEKLQEMQRELGGRAITVAALADLTGSTPGLVVAHAQVGAGPYSVDTLAEFARAASTFFVLLVSSKREIFAACDDLPPNVRASRLTYDEIKSCLLADASDRIQKGDSWDESSPLLRPPFMANVISLYMLCIANRKPTIQSHPLFFKAAASELADRGVRVPADRLTQDDLEQVLQMEYR